MMNKAMDAIRDEMAANPKDNGVQGVGEVMTALLKERPDIAPMVTAEGKTLKGAYQALYEYARKNKGAQGCFCMGDGMARELLAGYYGYKAEGESKSQTHADLQKDDLMSLLEDL